MKERKGGRKTRKEKKGGKKRKERMTEKRERGQERVQAEAPPTPAVSGGDAWATDTQCL